MRSVNRQPRHGRQKTRGKKSSCNSQRICEAFIILTVVIVLYEFVVPFFTSHGFNSGKLSRNAIDDYVGIENAALRCCEVKSGQARALVSTISECASLCSQNVECMSFDYDSGMCYLKRILSNHAPAGLNGLCKKEHAEECHKWSHYDFFSEERGT